MAEGLNVTIIGAGLAGLMAARVLREFHKVTLLERFSGNNQVGAAISFGPSATKIVEQYGLDRKRIGSVVWSETRTFDKEGNSLENFGMRQFAEHMHSDFLINHRVNLWQELLMMATAPSEDLKIGGGQPAQVMWNVDAVDVDCESGDVTLADGRTISSDLVIGADGIKSFVRPLVVGENAFTTARPSGLSAFRFTMPAATVREVEPDIYNLDCNLPAVVDVYLSMDGTNRSVVMYACRNFELLNFVCITPSERIGKETIESWTAEGTREDLVRCFGDFSEMIQNLFERAENIKLWQLRDQDPLPTYTKGRCVLIGDAAHAMVPHQVQGGTQSMEDAEGFVLFNLPGVKRESVPDILKDFERVRLPRASRIQNHSRVASDRKSPEVIFHNQMYNSTYGGIRECLSRLDAGQDMIAI